MYGNNTNESLLEKPLAEPAFADDLLAVARIDAVPRILEVVCRTTGLGFAAVARVTEDRWIACAVRDEIAFGLMPGGELPVETTICHEIRQSGRLVAIDHVDHDAAFCGHPTAKQYGFQSYISVPITLGDGRFFGTLCAIDPKPARVNTPATIHMFTLFAELIATHLDARDRVIELEATVATRTRELQQLNRSLQRAREDERTSLGRELHDEFGQSLTGLKLDLARVQRSLANSDPPDAALLKTISIMDGVVDTALDDIDRIVSDLRPAVLDTLGCVAASNWLVSQFERRSALSVTFDADEHMAIPSEAGTTVFRVLQEALTNVSRHARASAVSVRLCLDDQDVVLDVVDDGCGLTASDRAKPSAFGLRGMAERVASLNGTMDLLNPSEGGLHLTVRVPAQTSAGAQ